MTASTTLNNAVVAPMPKAMVRIARAAKPGVRESERKVGGSISSLEYEKSNHAVPHAGIKYYEAPTQPKSKAPNPIAPHAFLFRNHSPYSKSRIRASSQKFENYLLVPNQSLNGFSKARCEHMHSKLCSECEIVHSTNPICSKTTFRLATSS